MWSGFGHSAIWHRFLCDTSSWLTARRGNFNRTPALLLSLVPASPSSFFTHNTVLPLLNAPTEGVLLVVSQFLSIAVFGEGKG